MKRRSVTSTASAVVKMSWRSQILIFILVMVLGIIISNEFRDIRANNQELEAVRRDYDHYADLLQQERQRELNLEKRISDITIDLYSAYDRALEESGMRQLQQEWLTARILAGLTEVNGPGITITLDDAQGTGNLSALTIIHDSDVQYVIDTLRASGAKAIAINGERILGTSKLTCNGPTILINRKYCPVPYVITAVGNSQTMLATLNSDNLLLRRMADGIRISWKPADTVTVPAYLDLQAIERQVNLLEVVGS